MIKRTLHFGSPSYLNLRNQQLNIKITESGKERETTLPIEDIGMVVLEHPQINISLGAIDALLQNNVAVITCGKNRMPSGLALPVEGNTLFGERSRYQLSASEPLKKQVWQQTIIAKIRNQAAVLDFSGSNGQKLRIWSNEVKSGDGDRHEARAAAWYWPRVLPKHQGFIRDRNGLPPNHWLNYGYAILRAIIARSLVGAGLMPNLGVFHSNKYNAYCLADDIMEPYRPMVDALVINMMNVLPLDKTDITKEAKIHLLKIPTLDVEINGSQSPLMIAAQHTATSLVRMYSGEIRKMVYPTFKLPEDDHPLPF